MLKHVVVTLALIATPALADDLVINQTGFTAVHVNEDVTVTIKIGPEYSVTARAITGDLSHLDVNRYDGWLVFSRDARWFIFPNWRQDRFEVTITTPVLNEIKVFDGSGATVSGVTGSALRAEAASGGALVLLDTDVAALTLVVNDGGSLAASGSCGQLTIAGAGGLIDASALACATAVIPPQSEVMSMIPDKVRIVDAHPGPSGD